MDKEEDEYFWVINRRLEVGRKEIIFLKNFVRVLERIGGIWDIVQMRSLEALEDF